MKQIVAILAFLLFPGSAAAAGTMTLDPSSGAVPVNKLFIVDVLVHTEDDAVIAGEGEIAYDPTVLEVMDIITDDSVFSSWPTPPSFSSSRGLIKFAGWAKSEFEGDGRAIKIIFRPLKNAATRLRFESGSLLSARDRGSNILSSMESGNYTIQPEVVVAERSLQPVAQPEDQLNLPQEILVPQLWEYPIDPKSGERLILKGAAAPNTLVKVRALHESGSEIAGSALAALDGTFTFISDTPLQTGEYILTLYAEHDGRASALTEPKRIQVISNQVAAAAAPSGSRALTYIISGFAILGIAIIVAALGRRYS